MTFNHKHKLIISYALHPAVLLYLVGFMPYHFHFYNLS